MYSSTSYLTPQCPPYYLKSCRKVIPSSFNNCKFKVFCSCLTHLIIDLTLAYFSSFNLPSAHFLINTNICIASVVPFAYLWYVSKHYFINELYSFSLYNIYSFVSLIICSFDLWFYNIYSFLVLFFCLMINCPKYFFILIVFSCESHCYPFRQVLCIFLR